MGLREYSTICKNETDFLDLPGLKPLTDGQQVRTPTLSLARAKKEAAPVNSEESVLLDFDELMAEDGIDDLSCNQWSYLNPKKYGYCKSFCTKTRPKFDMDSGQHLILKESNRTESAIKKHCSECPSKAKYNYSTNECREDKKCNADEDVIEVKLTAPSLSQCLSGRHSDGDTEGGCDGGTPALDEATSSKKKKCVKKCIYGLKRGALYPELCDIDSKKICDYCSAKVKIIDQIDTSGLSLGELYKSCTGSDILSIWNDYVALLKDKIQVQSNQCQS